MCCRLMCCMLMDCMLMRGSSVDIWVSCSCWSPAACMSEGCCWWCRHVRRLVCCRGSQKSFLVRSYGRLCTLVSQGRLAGGPICCCSLISLVCGQYCWLCRYRYSVDVCDTLSCRLVSTEHVGGGMIGWILISNRQDGSKGAIRIMCPLLLAWRLVLLLAWRLVLLLAWRPV